MAASNCGNAVVGGGNLAVAGVRYNVPEPDEQDGATCWYYSALNMLKSWGLDGGKGGQALKKIDPRAPKYKDKDRSDILEDFLRDAEFSFKKEMAVDFESARAWLKEGPFLVSFNKHRKTSQATLWGSAVLRTTCQCVGPHMMLVVGYVTRKYKELRELMQSKKASGIADGVKESYLRNNEQRGETCELFLLDPNQPKMRPEYGPRSDVVLCGWFELINKGNINYALRVNMRK